MKYISLLMPKFLNHIDNQLMLHAPHIWRTRVHFVAFYALIAWILLFFIGFLYPLSMFDISRTPYAVAEIKHVSFLFLLICGFFGLVFWWQQVSKFRILAAKWYHSFMECALFFIGIFMLWQAVNAFQNGLDTNMAYRVGRSISAAEKEKLYGENFYLPGRFDYNSEIQFDINENENDKDSIPFQYFADAEDLLQVYHNRIHQQDVLLDSQFLIRKDNLYQQGSDESNFYRPYYSQYRYSYIYYRWKDSINRKAERIIKLYPQIEKVWNKAKIDYIYKWVKKPFSSDKARVLDSVYQYLSDYDKFQVDSVKAVAVNEMIDENRKQQRLRLPRITNELFKNDIIHILDTCSKVFFNHQEWTYLDILKSQNKNFESKFRENQIFSTFTAAELAVYKDYLNDVIQIMPVNNRNSINYIEVGLYYKKDSLTNVFLNKLSKQSREHYKEWMAFYMNNNFKKENAAEYVGNLRWNKKTGKYSEIEKYVTKGFLDTAFFYMDSIVSKKKKYRFDQIYQILNGWGSLSLIHNGVETWRTNKDTFLILSHTVEDYNRRTKKTEYSEVVDKKMRRDSIPIDTVFKWQVERCIEYRMDRVTNLSEEVNFTNYQKYRDTKITTEDSTFLDKVYTNAGYLRDSSEHSRLFFHANAYYLYLADISINKSRAFLTGWNPFYLSTNNKLAIIVIAFLMFFTTLAYSNLFTAIFAAFFINFVNNTLFNLGQNFQEVDKSKQTFWLFGLLAVLAFITAFNVLLRKFKLPVIYLLINVQLFAMLGIFVWLFDSQTIAQQSNYAYLAIAFWGLMVWKFRTYLALPSKR